MQRVPEIALVTVLFLGCAGALSGQVGLGGLPYPLRTDLPRPPGLNPPASAYTGILPGALQPTGDSCPRRPPVFVAPPYPYYVPVLYSVPGSSFSVSSAQPALPAEDRKTQAPVPAAATSEALAEQVQQLRSALQDLQRSRDASPPPVTSTPPRVAAGPEPPSVPLTVVLHTGQHLTIQSYAVMDGVLWDLSRQPLRRVPLAAIDLDGSRKATEAQGGEFPSLRPRPR